MISPARCASSPGPPSLQSGGTEHHALPQPSACSPPHQHCHYLCWTCDLLLQTSPGKVPNPLEPGAAPAPHLSPPWGSTPSAQDCILLPHNSASHPCARDMLGVCWGAQQQQSPASILSQIRHQLQGCTANLPAVLLQTCVNCCTVPRASFTGGGMQINCLFLALMVPHSWCRPTPSSNCFQTCSLSQSALGESPPPGKGFLEQQLCFSH